MLNQQPLTAAAPCSVPSTCSVVLPESLRNTLIVAIQVLLDSAVDNGRDRLRVLGFRSHDDEVGLELIVAKGTNPKTSILVVPIINRDFSSMVQWVLQGRSASAARAGGVTAAYWTPTQGCQLRWSKDMVKDCLHLLPNYNLDEANKAIAAAPSVPTLLLNGEEMRLPETRVCSYIYRALAGESVVVSNNDLDSIETFMACGLPLCSGRNPNQVGILDAFVLMKSKLFS